MPFDVSVTVPAGTSLLDAVRMAGLPLSAPCGGKGTCGDCVVQIIKGSCRTRPSAALSADLAAERYVLACLTEVTGDLVADLPRFEDLYIKSVASFVLPEDHKTEISGTYRIDPVVTICDVQLPEPRLEESYSDLRRLQREIQKRRAADQIGCEYSALSNLARTVREAQGAVTVVLLDDGSALHIIDACSGSGSEAIYGIACDIGTTTVALSVVDLTSGDIMETALGLNRQIKCGEDIISRISYAARPDRVEELQNLIVATLNDLIESATKACGILSTNIYYVSVAGNTTMSHMLLGLEPRYIRQEPYVPTFNSLPLLLARDLNLQVNPEARVHVAPAVGSYVGGDITAGLLATPILRQTDRVSMFIDAGTNGELVVGNKDWLMTCACSAGPAFEGGGVRCGMPATEGAIERIRLDDSGEADYDVIGGGKPKGICGSGLVDLLAELLSRGYLDRQGKFRTERRRDRIIDVNGDTGYLVEAGNNSFWGKDLVITERDIANLIRTKGAVFSACSLLLKNVGLTFDRIEAFYVAGGFGHHLNIENAIRIGLLPDLARERFRYLGNSSLLGAYLILVCDENRKTVDQISRQMTYLELNTEPAYMNEYTGALFLPHTDLTLFPTVRTLLNP
jgi:uncharacterized 2Fe-2S/4Fe-4S cluster protein (DUF4445 family)